MAGEDIEEVTSEVIFVVAVPPVVPLLKISRLDPSGGGKAGGMGEGGAGHLPGLDAAISTRLSVR